VSRALLALVAFALVVLVVAAGRAHELSSGTLSLEERTPGVFAMRWTPPATPLAGAVAVRPEFPEHCSVLPRLVDCGSQGLVGPLVFAGLSETSYRVLGRIAWHGGREQSFVVTGESPSVELRGALASAGAGATLRTAREYLVLGIEHILLGADHLAFVLGLLLLVRRGRSLLVTITAFTVAHSVTLAASVLEVARVPTEPVEAVIALSILLLAVECASRRESLSRRFPWLVAFAFGLLHGFGFAGALAELGLPPHRTALALALFNAGVELGQLAVVVAATALTTFAVRRVPKLVRGERPLVYAMGTLAAFWTIERLRELVA